MGVITMYKVIYMVADYEPWWKFDGWEQMIQQQKTYTTIEEAQQALQAEVLKMRTTYDNEQVKEGMYAFWREGDMHYCEACEDDAQIYHGLFIKKIY